MVRYGEVPNTIIPAGTNRFVPSQQALEGALRLIARGLPDPSGARTGWVLTPGYSVDLTPDANPSVTALFCLDSMRLPRGSTAFTLFKGGLFNYDQLRESTQFVDLVSKCCISLRPFGPPTHSVYDSAFVFQELAKRCTLSNVFAPLMKFSGILKTTEGRGET